LNSRIVFFALLVTISAGNAWQGLLCHCFLQALIQVSQEQIELRGFNSIPSTNVLSLTPCFMSFMVHPQLLASLMGIFMRFNVWKKRISQDMAGLVFGE
jgi:hypothetical protein